MPCCDLILLQQGIVLMDNRYPFNALDYLYFAFNNLSCFLSTDTL